MWSQPISYAEWIIAGLTLCYVIAAWFQWKALNRTVKIAHDSLRCTQEQIALGQRMAMAAEVTAELEHRAWVMLSDYSREPVTQEPQSLWISFKNFGKTPAFDVESRIHWQLIPAGVKVSQLRLAALEAASRSTLPPGEPANSQFLTRRIGDQEWQDLQTGRRSIYIWGEITYRDVMGTRRESRFCIDFDFKTQGWSISADYNSAT